MPEDEKTEEPLVDELALATIDDSLIERYQHRANIFMFSSLGVIALIFVLLGVMGFVFFFAQDIERGGNNTNIFAQIQQAKTYRVQLAQAATVAKSGVLEEEKVGQRNLRNALDAVEEASRAAISVKLIQEKERALEQHGYFEDLDSVRTKEELKVQVTQLKLLIKELEATLKATKDRFTAGEVTRTDEAQAAYTLAKINAELVLKQSRMATAPSAESAKKSKGEVQLLELIRVNLIRFGGIGVTLFLIGILIPIYRYNTRLAGFYLARADALRLCKEAGVRDFAAAARLLTPTHAFEKEPSTPIEALGALLRDSIKIARRTS